MIYVDHLRELSPSVSKKLGTLDIVGMRYYDGSHEYIEEATERLGCWQRLFLVRDVDNRHDKNAVMLHSGGQRLGYVVRDQTETVARALDDLRAQTGIDVVLVVQVVGKVSNWTTAIKVKPIAYSPERPARKFARSELKKGA